MELQYLVTNSYYKVTSKTFRIYYFLIYIFWFSVHSQVFKAMLQEGEYVEGQNNMISMDMTEEAIRAFLKFLYYRNIEVPAMNSSIALELLTCADKYGIQELAQAMWKILISQPDHWFDMNMTLRLFFFGTLKESFEDFRGKAIQILKQ